MGLLLARGKALPIALALLMIALFAASTDCARSEMPMSASGFAYGAGFVLATPGFMVRVCCWAWHSAAWGNRRGTLAQIAGVGMSALGVLSGWNLAV
jgi:hydrogenase/urease accessory protein HupE